MRTRQTFLMHQADRDKNGQEQAPTRAEGSRQAPGSTLETRQRRRKAVGCLLQVFALQLTLFGLLAWFVHIQGAYLIGGVLLGLAVAIYLPLKERGLLETPGARARMKRKRALRSFPTNGKPLRNRAGRAPIQ
jgi:hypothetical protein